MISVFEHLINRRTFAVSWHWNAEQCCDSWSNVDLADDALHVFYVLNTLAASDEDWRYAGAIVATIGGQALAMFGDEMFTVHVNDIAGVWAVEANDFCILVMECHSDDAVAVCVTISVEIVDDLFFEIVLVGWVNDAVFVAALGVDPDVRGTVGLQYMCYNEIK